MAAQHHMEMVVDLQKAAKAGQPAAQFLAVRHQTGNGVAKDSKQAFSLFKSAADQGITAAQLNVGSQVLMQMQPKQKRKVANILKKQQVMVITASFNLAMMEEQPVTYGCMFNEKYNSFQHVMHA